MSCWPKRRRTEVARGAETWTLREIETVARASPVLCRPPLCLPCLPASPGIRPPGEQAWKTIGTPREEPHRRFLSEPGTNVDVRHPLPPPSPHHPTLTGPRCHMRPDVRLRAMIVGTLGGDGVRRVPRNGVVRAAGLRIADDTEIQKQTAPARTAGDSPVGGDRLRGKSGRWTDIIPHTRGATAGTGTVDKANDHGAIAMIEMVDVGRHPEPDNIKIVTMRRASQPLHVGPSAASAHSASVWP